MSVVIVRFVLQHKYRELVRNKRCFLINKIYHIIYKMHQKQIKNQMSPPYDYFM